MSTDGQGRRRSLIWLGCGLSIGAGILLRPDGGILLAAVGGYLLWLLLRTLRRTSSRVHVSPFSIVWAGVLVAVGVTAPLIPWTLRNLHTMHRFQPLAPRYANDSDELVTTGFNRWVKTWIADYVSVQEIYWNVPGTELDFTRLPTRAFDSSLQRDQTRQLFADYNRDHDLTAELDARFAALAAERIHSAPLRFYLWLPAVRIADMWLRPRTELFPSDPRWWEFNDDRRWLALSLGLGLINLVYVAIAAVGLLRSQHNVRTRFVCFVSVSAICVSRHAGESRASLHSGMLSRGHSSRVRASCIAVNNHPESGSAICDTTYSNVSNGPKY